MPFPSLATIPGMLAIIIREERQRARYPGQAVVHIGERLGRRALGLPARVHPPGRVPPVRMKRDNPALAATAREIFEFVRPMQAEGVPMVRKGKDHDGGYVMLDAGLHDAIAYSLGISNDVSWDMDMAALGCHIFQYDHTIPGLPSEHPNFHFFRQGIAPTDSEDGVFASLTSLIHRNGHDGRTDLVLKMDIEDSEWDVLSALPEATLGQFSQIAVEFHLLLQTDQPDRRAKVLRTLSHLNNTHQAVHVHANNYGALGLISGVTLPDTLEITYVRRTDHRFVKTAQRFPTPLDMPNNPAVFDFDLGALGRDGAPMGARLAPPV